ncbi:unnamed protein product [Ectocarpus sp. CCAP 1310/34]|nr:unnamed protein product [Ectocarpus sp. CCAP 1310/34]
MGDYSPSDNTSNLSNTIRGLKKFDGRNPAEFEEWMKRLCVVLGVLRRDILPLLKGRSRPAETDDDYAAYCKSNEDLYAILYLLVELPASLSVQKHEDDSEISGDGQAAFEELNLNYNKVTDEDICVTGFTNEYKDVKMTMYRDPDFNVDNMQTTMRHMFLDEQSRKGPKSRIAGGGFALTTTTSEGPTCFDCGEKGHIRSSCPERKGKGTKKTKPAGANNNTGKALSACANCAHCLSASNKIEPATTKREASSTEAEIDFSEDGESEEGFMYATVHKRGELKPNDTEATMLEASSTKAEIDFSADGESEEAFMYATAHKGGEFEANAAGATLLVDTGASENMLDDRLIPGLKETMREFNHLAKPKVVSVGGDHKLDGNATGLIHCTGKYNGGRKQAVLLRGLVVPGLGRNVFSPTAQIKNGVKLVIEDGNPHLAVGGHILPLEQDSRDVVTADDDLGFAYEATVNATTLHRRLGYLNFRSMELLRKKEGHGVDSSDYMTTCDICAISKGRQLDLETENQLLRQEIRRMRHREELQQRAINTGHDIPPSRPHSLQAPQFSRDSREEESIKIPNTSKQKADGKLLVKLSVQGYVQESGIDYERSYAQESCIDYGRSYAPVCDIGSVRTLLAIASEQRWPVHQVNVTVASLQSAIDKDVRVKPTQDNTRSIPRPGTSWSTSWRTVNPLELQGMDQNSRLIRQRTSYPGRQTPSRTSTSQAGNTMFSSWTKHIDLRFSFQRELIKRNNISIHDKQSQAMLADVATKHLSRQQFISLLDHIKNFTC